MKPMLRNMLLCALLVPAVALAAKPAPPAAKPAPPAAKPAPPAAKPAPRPDADPPMPKPGTPGFALKLLTRFDDQYRGDKSTSVMTMSIKTRHWQRTLKMRSWSLGKDYSLVRILAPKKERGTATLKAGKDLYTWLSKTGRVIKVGGGMMGGSWMGSHFTNDDLVRETRLSEDFTIKQLPDAKVRGEAVWAFSLVPKPNVPVVWGKIVVELRQKDGQPLRQRFYDEEGGLSRTMTFSNHKRVGGRLMPLTMRMVPNDRPKGAPAEWTEVRMSEMDFSVKLDRSFFSLQRLKSL